MRQRIVATAIILATICAIGCRIDEDKHHGNDNVRIATPFGGMQVKTNNTDVLAGIGLPVYPGAILVRRKTSKDDSGSADINMSFGSFQLKIKAVSYRTTDSPQKVFDFYKNALGRFGNIIQCRNDHPIGTPTHTDEGLTCEDDHHHNDDSGDNDHPQAPAPQTDASNKDGVSPFDGSAKIQLKAGSKKHQHIVDINPDDGGAKFGLVSLDLPGEFHFGDRKDKDNKDDDQQ